MKVFKHELTAAIKNLKPVVPKSAPFPGLQGILVKDGVLTASNTELTMQVTMDAAKDEAFIIPEAAFNLIENLPEGEVEIREEDKAIHIKTSKIKNKFPSFDADTFGYAMPDVKSGGCEVIRGKDLFLALARVEFACAKEAGKPILQGVCIKREHDELHFVASDGHVLAWDRVQSDGPDMEIIIPQTTVKKLIGMGIDDDVEFFYDANHAVFRTEKYTVCTRLINGPYFGYKMAFADQPLNTSADRKELLEAVNRAKICEKQGITKKPITLSFSDDVIDIQRLGDDVMYAESIPNGKRMDSAVRISFDGGYMMAALKAFSSDMIYMSMSSGVSPVIFETDEAELKVLVLPVRTSG